MTISDDLSDDIRSFCARPHNWTEILYENMTTIGDNRFKIARNWTFDDPYTPPNVTITEIESEQTE